MERPPTSKARGICRYYQDPRGCWAGNKCKFLHSANPESDQGVHAKLTPYDQAKTCRYFAKGFCKKADKCWFKHVATESQASSSESKAQELDPEDELCSICFEKPTLFGLLAGCSHVFCITCIKQWRDPAPKSDDVVFSGVHKKCPMCRTPSRFITPSSLFFKQGSPRKGAIIAAYKQSMARVPCRHFVRSKANNGKPSCPFGKDCFYQHLNNDGTPYIFSEGADESMKRASRRSRHSELDVDSEDLFDIVANENAFRNHLDLFNRILQDEHLTHLTSTLQAVTDRFRQMEAGVQRPGDNFDIAVSASAQEPRPDAPTTIAINDRSMPITSWSLDPSPSSLRTLNAGAREVAPGNLANMQRHLFHSLDDFAFWFSDENGEETQDEPPNRTTNETVDGIDNYLAAELPRSPPRNAADNVENASYDTSMPPIHAISDDDGDPLWSDSESEYDVDPRPIFFWNEHLTNPSSDSPELTFLDDDSNSRPQAPTGDLDSPAGRATLDEANAVEESTLVCEGTTSTSHDTNNTASIERPRAVDGIEDDETLDGTANREDQTRPPFVTDGRGRVIGAGEESSGERDEGRWFLSRMLDVLF